MEQLLNSFRDANLAERLLRNVKAMPLGRVAIMEVCGTHTMAISRLGLRELLGDKVEFRSGPGCPVCVSDPTDIDRMIALARVPGSILATFGDMMRVPGSQSTLDKEKADGRDIRVVYSPLEAVRLAEVFPEREVIFLGIGFETTAPAVALALEQAVALGLKNFSIFSSHKLTPPAVRQLLVDQETKLDGFLCPGHVSTVTGSRCWEFIAAEFGIPAVIAGFEPVDILYGLEKLLQMVMREEKKLFNSYKRVVTLQGNAKARGFLEKYFMTRDAHWRGLGIIPDSGLALKEDFRQFDAEQRYEIEVETVVPHDCSCGDILKGKIIPPECCLFGTICTPREPVGPCMVSSEGACAAYYLGRG